MTDYAAELGINPEEWELALDWIAMLQDDFAEAKELDLHAAINSVSAKINAAYPALNEGEIVSFSLDDLGGALLTFSENDRREFLNATAKLFNVSHDGPGHTAYALRIAATQTRKED